MIALTLDLDDMDHAMVRRWDSEGVPHATVYALAGSSAAYFTTSDPAKGRALAAAILEACEKIEQARKAAA